MAAPGRDERVADAIRGELDKLRYLRDIDAHQLNLTALPDARRRRLAGVGRRSTNQALARRDPDRRFPVLLATVAQCSVEVLDKIVGMFDLALSGTENRARRKLDVQLAARARASESKLDLPEEILVDPAVADAEVGHGCAVGSGWTGCAPPAAIRRIGCNVITGTWR